MISLITVKNQLVLVHGILEKFDTGDYALATQMSAHYLLKCKTHSFSHQKWVTLKTATYYVVRKLEIQTSNITGNALSHPFSVFLTLIIYHIILHAVLAFNPCRNKC